MYTKILDALRYEFSAEAAKERIGGLIRFHRIQAGPEMRQAAHWCRDQLRAAGLEADILAYPARTDAKFWASHGFQEWECRSARLEVVSPAKEQRTLADYRESPIGVLQRSVALDAEAEVVVLADGTEPAHYENLEVRGKFVLTDAMVGEVYRNAMVARGAAGILCDGMRVFDPIRPKGDLPDARMYQGFWWFGEQPTGTGFVLTPRQGRSLRDLVAAEAKEGRTVRLRGVIDSALRDSEIEVVTTTIPGATDEEIVVVAHFCHPYGFANDNASGCCTVIEIAGALHRAIASGALAKPRRTIRILLVPEMTGTFCYLAGRERDLPKMLAGVNLDMVGEDQQQTGSSLIVEHEPLATGGNLSFLLEAVREALIPELKALGGVGGYATFRHTSIPFSGGSDHWILCDPTVGVPSAMLIQWPDRFYHTSADTMDKVDPKSLERAGLMAGTYAYFLANAGPGEAFWLAEELASRVSSQLAEEGRVVVRQALDADDASEAARLLTTFAARCELIAEATGAAFEHLRKFGLAEPEEFAPRVSLLASAHAARAWEAVERARGPLPEWQQATQEGQERAERLVPTRACKGPVWTEPALQNADPTVRARLHDLKKAHPDLPGALNDLALFWVDGARSLAEIARRTELEAGAACLPFLLGYFDLLAELGLVTIAEKVPAAA